MKKFKILILITTIGTALISCNKYLDVVPDNVATIDYAFNLRSSAEKYLFTCYSYLPDDGHFNSNPGFTAADEIWYPNPPIDVSTNFFSIALGLQNSANPFGNFWSGGRGGKPLFQGIRDCNIFLDNIDKVEEMDITEKQRWKAEVTFLKAYYHFYLMRMYGPIPLIKENLPISAGPDEVQVARQPIDSCVNYIVQLLDEAYANSNLPETLGGTEQSELGRITKPIVLAIKAKVLVTAASALYNGNPEYANYKDHNNVLLFNPTYSAEKWQRAVTACKEAIDFCTTNGYALNLDSGLATYQINDTIKTQLQIRTALTKENNTEVIWANPSSMANVNMQRWSMAIIAPGATSNSGPKGLLAPTINTVERFYTAHGLPITDDKTWDYPGRYELKMAGDDNRFHIALDSTTVKLHFNREPRFYASVGFDRGIWYGNWVDNYDLEDLDFIRARSSEISARQGISNYSITGYWIKKLVNIETFCADDGNITNNIVNYPWPEMRMSDLYLLYAEALNELNGYSPQTTEYINKVRARAGVPSVEEAWDMYSTQPGYYTTKDNLRKIIHQERNNELAFEGKRYWDLIRWKEAHKVLNQSIKGWDITQKSAKSFYRPVLLYNQHFTMKEYLYPIEIGELQINRKLVQNPGW